MALMLQGGDFVQKKLADPNGRVAALASSALSDREVVEELFLLALSRRPTAKELNLILDHFAKEPSAPRRQKYEDVLYALLNHTEFLFQH
jgi:hypothetical protein